MSNSSIFGGGRLPSPAPGILCRSTTTSSSPGLLSRLSENQIASKSLAPPPQNHRQPSWQGQQGQAYQQPLAEPLAPPPARFAIPKAHQPSSDLSVRSVATAPVDWSSYLDDSNVSGGSEPAGRPDSKAPAFESVFSMCKEAWCGGEQHASHSKTVPKLHRRSPMDAKLQPLIAGPSEEHATRLLQQQQLRGRILPDEHDSRQLQQQLPRQDVQSGAHASRLLPQQQPQGDKPLRDAHASKPTGSFVSGATGTKAGRRLLVQPVLAATDLTECTLEPSTFMPSRTLHEGAASSRMTTDPNLDKENAQQAGHRAPVRKVLFAGHSNSEGQVSARAISLPPAPSYTANGADKPGLSMPSADSQAAVAVRPAETPVHNACHASLDFSSVFDFL